MTTQTETRRFEAEVREVLGLVIHSLYKNREIFLRELISNASDALDKLHFEALTRPELLPEGETLGIALDVDREARVLRVADNGIGMSHDELVANLGTVASSGTRRFLEELHARGSQTPPELIGQFGVGFYAAFMVADEVVVETRRAGEEQGWRWRSRADGEYTIEPLEGLERGTVVNLHLREPGSEDDGPDLLAERTLRELVERYSDFVEYPIQMEVEAGEGERRTETLNSRRPLWARPKDEIGEEEHQEFYRHLTHDWNGPARAIHFRAEGALEYTALLYLPKERPLDLFDPDRRESSLSLYVRRVSIMRECPDLLPPWLRFVRGVVEANDLPLNVSRETLQDDPRVRQIRKRLVKKVLEVLSEMLAEDRSGYETFWAGFGPVLKEGIYFGEDEDGRVSRICLFQSSRQDGPTTLGEYVGRMPAGQEAIYTITGPDRATLSRSPHLEVLDAKGQEALLLTDPVDEWMLERLTEFEGHALKALDRGEVDLEGEQDKRSREKLQEECADLLDALRAALDDSISEVRFSSRLQRSPAVLVTPPHGLSPHLERMLRRSGREVPEQKRILELNATHPLIEGLKALHASEGGAARVGEYAELLLGQAALAEGAPLRDPVRFAGLVAELMLAGLGAARA